MLSEDYCEPSAWDYRGSVAVTATGRTCQDWAAQTPHEHSRTPNNYPEFGLEGEHNYCRNPDGEATAWCYTTDPSSRWELCDIGEPAGAEVCGVSTDPCSMGGITTDEPGDIDYDDGHSNGQDCRWALICPDGQAPTVTFNTFNTEANFDYVNIYDGDSVDAVRIGRLHGTDVPDPITSSQQFMVVQFTSDGSVTRDGFHGTWSCGEAAAPPPPDPCAGAALEYADGEGLLDFASGHGNNEDCRWQLTCSTDGQAPTVTFTTFNTEANFDYVNVYDGSTTDDIRIGRLHGTSLPDPSPLTATKVKALILDLVHNMDVVDQLARSDCRAPTDWAWSKQLRLYDEGGGGGAGQVVLKMVDARFDYTYEYQGNAPKLVHTPLTDKCYLTLTQVTD